MNFGEFENCLLRTNIENRCEAQEILAEDTYQGREDSKQSMVRDTLNSCNWSTLIASDLP